ncbi:MAG: serine/threonine protein kinase [Phycisphaerales bacterium]
MDEPRERWDAIVREACPDDPLVRNEALSLLNRLSPDVTRTTLATPEPDAQMSGSSIGPYRLLKRIGEGGFGTVFEAEQRSPVRRRVALKIVKPGMDSAAVIARFKAERQALAVMDHPCIAKVFDGGIAGPEHGQRPFFVMELIKGTPITEYCDQRTLSISDRCSLFLTVCEAVQHAHAKGVVHRDLKPANILVSTGDDGKPAPKIIDFGIAKALHQPLTEQTIATAFGQLIGTPSYMSPEQAGCSGLDIDTRSDVYSLGTVLYELLSGLPPFDMDSFRAAALVEIQRVISAQDPPMPSMRLASLSKDGSSTVDESTIATARRSTINDLARSFKRDLDWIVMRALERDRERRYQTASALAADLGRFLRGEPVEAGPPSATYRLSKFIGRHRAWTAASVMILILLLVTIASVGYGLFEASERQRQSIAAQSAMAERIEELERVLALQRSMQVQLSGSSLARSIATDIVASAASSDEAAFTIGASSVRASTALRDALGLEQIVSRRLHEMLHEDPLEYVNEQLVNDPFAQARLLFSIGISMAASGRHAEAIPVFQRSESLLRNEHELDHDRIADAGVRLIRSARESGDLSLARSMLAERLAFAEASLAPFHRLNFELQYEAAVIFGESGDEDALGQASRSLATVVRLSNALSSDPTGIGAVTGLRSVRLLTKFLADSDRVSLGLELVDPIHFDAAEQVEALLSSRSPDPRHLDLCRFYAATLLSAYLRLAGGWTPADTSAERDLPDLGEMRARIAYWRGISADLRDPSLPSALKSEGFFRALDAN